MFFLNEETTVAETLEVVQEVQQDLEQLKPNVVLETLKSWIPGLTKLGYRLLVAALIVCIGFQFAKMLRKMLERSLIRMDMEVSIRKFLQSAVYVTICGLTIFIAADKLGISSASIVAILGSVGLALSLSLQDMLANFAGGIVLLLIRPFKVGDYIICGGQEGTVRSIGLVYTTWQPVEHQPGQCNGPGEAVSGAKGGNWLWFRSEKSQRNHGETLCKPSVDFKRSASYCICG